MSDNALIAIANYVISVFEDNKEDIDNSEDAEKIKVQLYDEMYKTIMK